jgi:hypothetical protein
MTPQEHFEQAESFAGIASKAYRDNDDEACALASQVGALHVAIAQAAFTRELANATRHIAEFGQA